MMDPYQRALDFIDNLGGRDWRDREAQGRVRWMLGGLQHQGLLDRDSLKAEMKARGYDAEALQRLDDLVDKSLRDMGVTQPNGTRLVTRET
ncbi:hypothetical protein [Kocuria rhizosphaericola]|uniref:hypothetical protein n=1 Tax=Kocuria rhizosphaericola TaxID=3376284 RepID=UPI0037A93059